MGLGTFLLGAMFGSTHTIETETKIKVNDSRPALTREQIYATPLKFDMKEAESKPMTREDFIGKPLTAENIALYKHLFGEDLSYLLDKQ